MGLYFVQPLACMRLICELNRKLTPLLKTHLKLSYHYP